LITEGEDHDVAVANQESSHPLALSPTFVAISGTLAIVAAIILLVGFLRTGAGTPALQILYGAGAAATAAVVVLLVIGIDRRRRLVYSLCSRALDLAALLESDDDQLLWQEITHDPFFVVADPGHPPHTAELVRACLQRIRLIEEELSDIGAYREAAQIGSERREKESSYPRSPRNGPPRLTGTRSRSR
jgi:hypothetical protein